MSHGSERVCPVVALPLVDQLIAAKHVRVVVPLFPLGNRVALVSRDAAQHCPPMLSEQVQGLGFGQSFDVHGSAVGGVKAVEVAQGPFPVTLAGADHRDASVRVERPEAAEVQRQGVEPAKRRAAEPAIVRAAVKLQGTVETVHRGDVVPVQKNHCVWSFDVHAGVGL